MAFFTTYFSTIQLVGLLTGLLAIFATLVFHFNGKYKASMCCLVVAAFGLFWFAAHLDPFLNLWDERFHALVAKNMMKVWYKPTLYLTQHLELEVVNWSTSHIWLHKQPLFLWQMALSMRLFGSSVTTIRLPDIVLGAAVVLAVYRSGYLLVNRNVGLYAALFTLSAPFSIALISGRQMTDHNDFVFMTYVTLSIWSLIEYVFSGKRIWLVLVGCFAGCAILTKWLVGLLVFLIWFLYHTLEKNWSKTHVSSFLTALGLTLLIALPWQIFILVNYHNVAIAEYQHHSSHLFNVVEGHHGSIWYHFTQFDRLFGALTGLFFLVGVVFLILRNKNKKLVVSVLLALIFVYIFFTIVATKMPSFTFILLLPISIGIGCLWNEVLELIFKKRGLKIMAILATFGFVVIRLNIEELQLNHTIWKEENWFTPSQIALKEFYEGFSQTENTVIFNAHDTYVQGMFYTDATVYSFIPSQEQLLKMQQLGKHVVVLKMNQEKIPSYLRPNENVEVVVWKGQAY